jgi:release factor glutamine methyltransferase
MAEYHPLRTADQFPTTTAYTQLNASAEQRAKLCHPAQMPNLSHLQLSDYDNVYSPSDDTYLLLDAIGFDMDAMFMSGDEGGDTATNNKANNDKMAMPCPNVRVTLEIGCGTGVPTVYLAKRLRNGSENKRHYHQHQPGDKEKVNKNATDYHCHIQYHVTDINPHAIRIAKTTAEKNNIPASNFHVHNCDLASDLLPQLSNQVDILIFNPPYVPTPNEEVGSNGIEASWAGGTNGRLVLDRALPQIAQLLAYPHGVAYIVVVDDNYPEQICQWMEKKYGILAIPWMRRKARNEFLTILKMTNEGKGGGVRP